jgi:hypothetical protein
MIYLKWSVSEGFRKAAIFADAFGARADQRFSGSVRAAHELSRSRSFEGKPGFGFKNLQ